MLEYALAIFLENVRLSLLDIIQIIETESVGWWMKALENSMCLKTYPDWNTWISTYTQC